MRTLIASLLLATATPALAQESPAFPRFSLTGGQYFGKFTTDVRVNPDATSEEGTTVSFERDLGLDASKDLQRFGLQWRPFHRHELAANHFSASRSGLEEIDREIRFRDELYPVRARVETELDLDYWDATYTLWAKRTQRGGLGITLGVAGLSIDASLIATRPDIYVTITEQASTDVPVALAGAQLRYAFTPRFIGEASAATLPRVNLGDYSGSAVTAAARLEFRIVRNVGIGAAYHHFDLDVEVLEGGFTGALQMRVEGAEAFVRFAF